MVRESKIGRGDPLEGRPKPLYRSSDGYLTQPCENLTRWLRPPQLRTQSTARTSQTNA